MRIKQFAKKLPIALVAVFVAIFAAFAITACAKPAQSRTVTFNANGGTFGTEQTQSVSVNVGATVKAPTTPPTREGYTFDKWYQEVECLNAFNFDTAINTDVTIYAGWTAVVPEKTVSSIAVTKLPTKTIYKVGESFDAAGLEITATFSDKTTQVITDYTLSQTTPFTEVGDQVITVTYQGKTATVTVKVESDNITLTSIAVTKQPTKKTYEVGEQFAPSGMVVTATYSNETTKEITDYTVSPTGAFTEAQVGNLKLTIGYGGKTTQIDVTVLSPINRISAVSTFSEDYEVGDTVDKSTITVTAHRKDDTTFTVNAADFTVSPTTLNTAGNEVSITVTYTPKNLTCTLKVRVVNRHTVTFEANAPSAGLTVQGMPNSQRVTDGTKATKPSTNPTCNGYRFVGWFTDANGTTAFDFTGSTVTQNISIYAKWIQQITLTFDVNAPSGQTVTPIAPIVLDINGTLSAENIAAITLSNLTNYNFKGYKVDNAGALLEISSFNNYTATANTKFVAQWIQVFTVKFDKGEITETVDNLPADQRIENGSTMAAPTHTPSSIGYKVTGYTYVPTGASTNPQPFVFGETAVTQNITVTVLWQEDNARYEVKFLPVQPDSSLKPADTAVSGMPENITDIRNGATIPEEKQNPTAPSCTDTTFAFDNWYYLPNGTETVFDFSEPITETVEVYAKWLKIYTATFDVNAPAGSDITVTIASKTMIDTKGNITIPTELVVGTIYGTTAKYRFDGWKYSDAAAAGDAFVSFPLTLTADKTLTAIWTQIFTVTVDLNDGSQVTTQQIPNGDTATAPANPTREGYRFLGWFTQATNGTSFDFSATITADTKVYAQWKQQITITFGGCDGATNAPEAKTIDIDTAITAPTAPTKTGYKFLGWYTQATGGVEINFANAFSADTEIFAQWAKLGSIKFNGNKPVDAEGEVTGVPDTVYATDLGVGITPPSEKPVLAGYKFIGWYLEATFETIYDGTFISNTETEVFAKWSKYAQDGYYLMGVEGMFGSPSEDYATTYNTKGTVNNGILTFDGALVKNGQSVKVAYYTNATDNLGFIAFPQGFVIDGKVILQTTNGEYYNETGNFIVNAVDDNPYVTSIDGVKYNALDITFTISGNAFTAGRIYPNNYMQVRAIGDVQTPTPTTEDGVYVFGNFTDWGAYAEYRLTADLVNKNKHTITELPLDKYDEYKIVVISGATRTYYGFNAVETVTANAENIQLHATGTYNIGFGVANVSGNERAYTIVFNSETNKMNLVKSFSRELIVKQGAVLTENMLTSDYFEGFKLTFFDGTTELVPFSSLTSRYDRFIVQEDGYAPYYIYGEYYGCTLHESGSFAKNGLVADVVTSIDFDNRIHKFQFYVGDAVDTSEVTVKVTYQSGYEAILSINDTRLTVVNYDTSALEDASSLSAVMRTFTVSMGGKTLQEEYNVFNKITAIQIAPKYKDGGSSFAVGEQFEYTLQYQTNDIDTWYESSGILHNSTTLSPKSSAVAGTIPVTATLNTSNSFADTIILTSAAVDFNVEGDEVTGVEVAWVGGQSMLNVTDGETINSYLYGKIKAIKTTANGSSEVIFDSDTQDQFTIQYQKGNCINYGDTSLYINYVIGDKMGSCDIVGYFTVDSATYTVTVLGANNHPVKTLTFTRTTGNTPLVVDSSVQNCDTEFYNRPYGISGATKVTTVRELLAANGINLDTATFAELNNIVAYVVYVEKVTLTNSGTEYVLSHYDSTTVTVKKHLGNGTASTSLYGYFDIAIPEGFKVSGLTVEVYKDGTKSVTEVVDGSQIATVYYDSLKNIVTLNTQIARVVLEVPAWGGSRDWWQDANVAPSSTNEGNNRYYIDVDASKQGIGLYAKFQQGSDQWQVDFCKPNGGEEIAMRRTFELGKSYIMTDVGWKIDTSDGKSATCNLTVMG